jgi:hypothetical protein
MEVQGRIYKLLQTRAGNRRDGSAWRSQEFILEYFETPEQRWSDKVVLSVMDNHLGTYEPHEGDEVKVGFSHNVREWNGKYYNDLHVYKFEKVKGADDVATQSQQTGQQEQQTGKQAAAQAPQPAAEEKKEDDLPF